MSGCDKYYERLKGKHASLPRESWSQLWESVTSTTERSPSSGLVYLDAVLKERGEALFGEVGKQVYAEVHRKLVHAEFLSRPEERARFDASILGSQELRFNFDMYVTNVFLKLESGWKKTASGPG